MLKIFLVEDEVVVRNGIKKSISWEKEGFYFAGEASDGELASPLIKREKPDILITDIKMPLCLFLCIRQKMLDERKTLC
jgi:two-component system response regulator YesN